MKTEGIAAQVRKERRVSTFTVGSVQFSDARVIGIKTGVAESTRVKPHKLNP